MKNILTGLLMMAASMAAQAGQQDSVPTIFSKLKPKVGQWGEYQVEGKKGDKTQSKGVFRMAVVGKDGEKMWLEQKMTREIPAPKKDEPAGVIKMLVGKDGVEKAFVKGPQGVIDMSEMMKKSWKKSQQTVENAKMTKVGQETVEVPAGKFKATHYTFGDEGKSEAWIKEGAGPYGLIKQVHRSGKSVTEVVLKATGSGAKSEVDESKAVSGFGAAMMEAQRKEAAKKGEAPPEKPDMGGMFKSILKKKAGLGD